VTTYGATTNEIVRMRRDLEAAAVTVVVMEATGDYSKPFYFLLAESPNVQLVNAKAARISRAEVRCFRRDVAGRACGPQSAAGQFRAARADPSIAEFDPHAVEPHS